jgi:tRNA 2-thiouridine synthesizing protein A
MSVTLDATRLHCPEPVLRTAKAMRNVAPGDTLTVLATDPVATIDFPYYCHHAGLDLVSTARQAEVLIFKIRKPVRPVPLAPNRPIG